MFAITSVKKYFLIYSSEWKHFLKGRNTEVQFVMQFYVLQKYSN